MLLNAVIAVLALAAIPLAILLAFGVNWFVKNRCQSGNKGCRVQLVDYHEAKDKEQERMDRLESRKAIVATVSKIKRNV